MDRNARRDDIRKELWVEEGEGREKSGLHRKVMNDCSVECVNERKLTTGKKERAVCEGEKFIESVSKRKTQIGHKWRD